MCLIREHTYGTMTDTVLVPEQDSTVKVWLQRICTSCMNPPLHRKSAIDKMTYIKLRSLVERERNLIGIKSLLKALDEDRQIIALRIEILDGRFHRISHAQVEVSCGFIMRRS